MDVKRVQLSPEQVAAQRDGGHRLGPGVWLDRNGHMHWSVPELLAHFELADTDENRAAVVAILSSVHEDAGFSAIIIQKDE